MQVNALCITWSWMIQLTCVGTCWRNTYVNYLFVICGFYYIQVTTDNALVLQQAFVRVVMVLATIYWDDICDAYMCTIIGYCKSSMYIAVILQELFDTKKNVSIDLTSNTFFIYILMA